MDSLFSLIIIGGGSAGFAAATKANDLEINTALINSGPLGGTCVNIGCVPSKYLLKVGEILYQARKPKFDGITIDNVQRARDGIKGVTKRTGRSGVRGKFRC